MNPQSAPLWQHVATFLLLASVAMTTARVVTVERVVEPTRFRTDADPATETSPPLWPAKRPIPIPSSSPNDRSRWVTVRTLVDSGSFVIGKRKEIAEQPGYKDSGPITEPGWGTIDMVLHPDRQEFYSSKPPLLAVFLAGEYWVLKQLFGWEITERPFEVMRTILLTFNVLPLLPYLWLVSRLIARYGSTDWGRLLVFATACFGTFVTTFAITLNNHTPATFCALFALAPILLAQEAGTGWLPGRLSAWRLAVSGFFAGLTVSLDLPAAALLGSLAVLVLVSQPRMALLTFVPAALVPIAALLWTNHLALGEWLPAYEKFDTVWYRYPGSHWSSLPVDSIDGLEEPKWRYGLNVTVGHHGIFSLTPVFIVSAVGAVLLLWRAPARSAELLIPRLPRWFGALTLAVTVVVVTFYIVKTNNYGGTTAGLRWVFWLTPLWLLSALPAADWLARRAWGRWLGGIALAVSVFSATWPVYQVWRHPWIYQYGELFGWWRIG